MDSKIFTNFTAAFLYSQEVASEKPVICTDNNAIFVVAGTEGQAARAYYDHVTKPLVKLDRETLTRSICDALEQRSANAQNLRQDESGAKQGCPV